jgi:maleylacetoacetate isomerase
MHLYGYYRSSAAYRVRIALNLKGLDYDMTSVHLRDGNQFDPDYVKLNPQAQVPTLVLDDGTPLVQSPAILEYLEEVHPEPALLPADTMGRYRVRALAAVPGCDIHPIGNLRVLKHIQQTYGQDMAGAGKWAKHWIELGYTGLERMLADSPETGRFCHGDTPTLADIFLMPQMYNALRFGVDMGQFPTIQRINDANMELEAVQKAYPDNQPDFEPA